MGGQDEPYDLIDEFEAYGPTMDESVPIEDQSGHESVPEVLGGGWEDWLGSGGRAYEDRLAELYPENQHIRAKIRQQLQVFRDEGLIEFLGDGEYRLRWIDNRG